MIKDYKYIPINNDVVKIIIQYARELKNTGEASITNFEMEMSRISSIFENYNECRRELEKATIQCADTGYIKEISNLYYYFYPELGQ